MLGKQKNVLFFLYTPGEMEIYGINNLAKVPHSESAVK